MQQDGQVRTMSREEKDSYRGVTVDESGAASDASDQTWDRERMRRSSVRYVRIGHAGGGSVLRSLIWSVLAVSLLALFIFVALPAIVMVLIAVLVAGTIIRLVGPQRILSWIMRKLYGR